ncbi:MAG: uroporphyrinogen-III C-methyltransferase [Firmicutes bacterium]|nr:uroporphyrinogen-III C-methyltransferase [Bacillota bacterium]
MSGKVYLIGAGPGDHRLITLKALEYLKEADVVVFDRLVNPKILQYAKDQAELIDVGKMPDSHPVLQHEINDLIINRARSGKIVARLKSGDPFVYCRGGDEAESLHRYGIDFEVIPGITIATSVPAYAGIPVIHRDFCSSFHVITGQETDRVDTQLEYQELAQLSGTLVFLIGIRHLPEICKNLIFYGKNKDTPVAVIEKGATIEQRVITGTLENISEKVKYLKIYPSAVTVIGEVVRLKDRLGWYPKGPLAGKRIVVARTQEQANELAARIEALGGEAIEFPTIKIAPPPDYIYFDQALDRIATFHWLIFTGAIGVQAFFRRLKERNMDIRLLFGAKLCAIGTDTQAGLLNLGLQVDFTPEQFTTRGLLEGLLSKIRPGERVLLARADTGNPELAEGLKAQNILVEDLIVYRTLPDGGEKEIITELLKDGKIHYFTFTSPSTVSNFMSVIGSERLRLVNRCKIICIGPITAKIALDFGLNVSDIATHFSYEGIMAKLINQESWPANLPDE